jgi:hypothetical protein
MLVFDAKAWTEAGGDVGDNSCFWKEADIVEYTLHDGERTATVRFLEDNRISRGHFLSGMRMELPPLPPYECSCEGCWACSEHEENCTCDFGWDRTAEERLER